jgi:biotin transporter BioY
LHTDPNPVNEFACIIINMYIIAIGWLYVTVLLAASEPSIVVGILSFLFYGLLPCSILLWMSGSKVRRQRRAYQELLADQRARDNDRGDTQPDQ